MQCRVTFYVQTFVFVKGTVNTHPLYTIRLFATPEPSSISSAGTYLALASGSYPSATPWMASLIVTVVSITINARMRYKVITFWTPDCSLGYIIVIKEFQSGLRSVVIACLECSETTSRTAECCKLTIHSTPPPLTHPLML